MATERRSRHHHHHRSRWSKIRHFFHRYAWLFLLLLLIAVLAAGAAIVNYRRSLRPGDSIQPEQETQVTAEGGEETEAAETEQTPEGLAEADAAETEESEESTTGDMSLGGRYITYEGRKYQYNNLITTILYAGVDTREELSVTGYMEAPRADSIHLLVIDEQNRRITVMSLSRDTMTEITRYLKDGTPSGEYLDHLGYAYTYGDGGETSASNLVNAVSNLLYGVPVKDYVVTNMNALTDLAEMVGDVTVTVPNDSLADADPAYQEGAQVVINKDNIESFIRKRDVETDFSNAPRMERQQAYMSAAMSQLLDHMQQDPNGTWKRFENLGNNLRTSITRSQYMDLVNALEKTSGDYVFYTPEGVDETTEDYDEFYVDETKLLDKVVETFYITQ